MTVAEVEKFNKEISVLLADFTLDLFNTYYLIKDFDFDPSQTQDRIDLISIKSDLLETILNLKIKYTEFRTNDNTCGNTGYIISIIERFYPLVKHYSSTTAMIDFLGYTVDEVEANRHYPISEKTHPIVLEKLAAENSKKG